MGTVVLDVEPAARHNQALIEAGPEGAMAQSPFWMGFFDDRGSVAYIHSIDQNYGDVFGVGRVAGMAYKARWRRGGPWTSKRLIEARGLRQLDAFLVNHSPASGRTTLRWLAHPSGATVVEHSLEVAGHGVARATLTAADVERAGGLDGEYLHLEVDDLLTSNGKPYLMSRYGAGPFSLHHG